VLTFVDPLEIIRQEFRFSVLREERKEKRERERRERRGGRKERERNLLFFSSGVPRGSRGSN